MQLLHVAHGMTLSFGNVASNLKQSSTTRRRSKKMNVQYDQTVKSIKGRYLFKKKRILTKLHDENHMSSSSCWNVKRWS